MTVAQSFTLPASTFVLWKRHLAWLNCAADKRVACFSPKNTFIKSTQLRSIGTIRCVQALVSTKRA